jgi:hypothetical protein
MKLPVVRVGKLADIGQRLFGNRRQQSLQRRNCSLSFADIPGGSFRDRCRPGGD